MNGIDHAAEIASRHKTELGYVLRRSLEMAARRGELYVMDHGFASVWRRRDKQTTIHSIVSEQVGTGAALLGGIIRDSRAAGQASIVAKCVVGLPANDWYARRGFVLVVSEPGKHRALNVWRLEL